MWELRCSQEGIVVQNLIEALHDELEELSEIVNPDPKIGQSGKPLIIRLMLMRMPGSKTRT